MYMGTFENTNNTPLTLYSDETGEVFAEKIQFVRKGKKFMFPGGFAMVGLSLFGKLAEVKMVQDGHRLIANMMASSPYGNYVNKSNEQYAKDLGFDKHRVSRMVGKLHEAGIIHRIGPSTVLINPSYFFRGTPEEQERTIEEWSKLRRSLMGKAKRKRA